MSAPVRPALARAAIAAVLLIGVAAGTATATSTPTAAPAPAPQFTETFSSPTWYQAWGRSSAPWHTSLQQEGTNQFLRTHIDKGSHDGTSFFKLTGTYDAVTLRYRIRFGAGFDPSKSWHDVKLPGFGSPVLDPQGVCLSGCGGAPADGVLGYSARVDIQDTGIPGFYVYDMNPVPSFYGRGMRWNAPAPVTGQWYTVEVAIAMNHVGHNDGVLRAKINGTTVFERHDLTFRIDAGLHVKAAWFDIYYGGSGTAPAATDIDIDDVALYAGVI